jgi:hypothetical protein
MHVSILGPPGGYIKSLTTQINFIEDLISFVAVLIRSCCLDQVSKVDLGQILLE